MKIKNTKIDITGVMTAAFRVCQELVLLRYEDGVVIKDVSLQTAETANPIKLLIEGQLHLMNEKEHTIEWNHNVVHVRFFLVQPEGMWLPSRDDNYKIAPLDETPRSFYFRNIKDVRPYLNDSMYE